MPLDRRGFLHHSFATGAVLALHSLAACYRETGAVPSAGAGDGGYGPLSPSADCPELALPPGFSCRRLSQAGLPMADGNVVPGGFDGMAAFGMGPGVVRLVRNHEIRGNPGRVPPIDATRPYDAAGSGGTVTLEVAVRPDGSAEARREFVSLSGTEVNCAGGPTPWGSWLTCEETVTGPKTEQGNSTGFTRRHGYVFEVPAGADGPVVGQPLRAMGRMVHEAVAVDPATGVVYLTEDRNPSGFYRFLPHQPGHLAAGGRLQMLAIADHPRYDSRTGQPAGVTLPATWVDIADPDPDSDWIDSLAVFHQGAALGGAQFARLEGCWFGEGAVYFDATSGGDRSVGQIWRYQADGPDRGTLTLVFESPDAAVLNMPDNLCLSPRGGLVLCEDNGVANHVRGLTGEGKLVDLVANVGNRTEFCGICFAPQGRTLFVNLQGDRLWDGSGPRGATYAIWGPWEAGAL